MYIAIDMKRLAVVYRHEKIEVLRSLINIELVHVYVGTMEETNFAAYGMFPIEKLQELFKNLTGGTDPHSFNRDYVIGQIIRLCQTIQQTDADSFYTTVQSLQIPAKDLSCYKYHPGASKPIKLEEPYNPPALVGNWEAAQALAMPTAQTAQPSPVAAPAVTQSWAVAPTATPPKYAPPWA